MRRVGPILARPVIGCATALAATLALACGSEPGAGRAAPPQPTGAAARMAEARRGPARESWERGMRNARSDRLEVALELFEQALAEDDAPAELHFRLGQCRLRLADVELGYRTQDASLVALAVADLQRARERAPGDAEVALWLGQGLEAAEDYEGALTAYGDALELAPDDVETMRRLAALHVDHGEPERARGLVERALRLAPDDADVAYWSARLAEIDGDLEAARAEYERVVAAQPSRERARLRLGEVLLRLGREEEGERELEEYRRILALKRELHVALERVRARPEDARAQRELGRIQLELGSAERALRALQRSLEAEPDDAATLALIERARALEER